MPENPTDADEVFLVTHLYGVQAYLYPGAIVEQSNDVFQVSVCFNVGGYNPNQPRNYYDTISLGFLSVSNYELNYTLSITSGGLDCSENDVNGTKDLDFFVDRFLSSNEDKMFQGSNDFIVYPNPSNDRITIDYHIPENTNISLEVFDATGRKIATHRIENQSVGENSITISVAHLSKGMYILNLNLGEDIISRKIIKN